MSENQTNLGKSDNSQIVIKMPSKSELLKSKWLSPSTYILIFVFFFFTFCDVSCSRQLITSVKGIDFIFGKTISSDLIGSIQTIPSNFWAILAFVSCLFGLSLFIRKLKYNDFYLFLTSVVGFLSLIILQITILFKVSKSGEGQVNISFQFAYWASLLSFFINAILSYFRYKNDISNKPTLKQIIANIKENKYVKYSFIALIVIIILLLFNNLFLNNPKRLGHIIANDYKECQTDFSNALINKYNSYLSVFDASKFKKRQHARNVLDSLTSICEKNKKECNSKIDWQVEKIKIDFKGNTEKFNEFKNAYFDELNNSNDELSNKISNLKKQIEDKISSINDPEPDSEKIKIDIIGKRISNWRFADISEIKTLKIESSKKTDRYLNLICYTDLEDMNNHNEYRAILNIRYVCDNGEWILNKISEIYYGDKSSDILNNGKIAIEGEWSYPNNTAIYNHDGTWSGIWKDGSIKKGTFEIVDSRITIYEDNGYKFASGDLVFNSENQFSIKSWLSASTANRIIK
ncbi:MAG: hypothetical protein DRJ01_12080 [Bacteroidetes bacterium]|nr:MAG: hypothetical protein DRJ01_12080 [Bacteroidota bacterium]